ncbi:uncharacterized protein N7458_012122 [Penicillium daleae]|jgi:hypothetical protein|uniref:Uncharacterized protein n=1 Tax=Penicillium daleae TaxID=63821 RepID=A0AAD6BTK7_9EURO|nr:uncharacterized protein N7458_012122 [Penicillium daleae]KAJ5432966.1 hypothetical protein N7458_012122 [Penicillium daleae]
MPASKTDTAMRFPASDTQKRRAWTTQDKKATSKEQSELSTGKSKAEDSSTWSPEQLLASHMDVSGNPVPDPVSFGDGAKAKKAQRQGSMTDEPDLFEAMNAETADFD